MRLHHILVLSFILLFSFVSYAQNPGDVVRYKKIGNNLGGLGNVLSSNSYFGASTCSIGDVNGDGIDDLAVGANRYGTCGAVFILFMDTNGIVSSQTILEQNSNGISGLTNNGLFGHDICAMGDINSDGIPDIGISELQCSDGGSNTGAIHIITLNSSGHAISQTKISKTNGYLAGGLPLQIGAFFGANIDSIGDLNNDGVIDLVVGNHHDDSGGVNKGAAWVLLLDTNHNISSYYKIYDGVTNFNAPIDTYDYFGVSCCGIGDYDNDGIPDIAIGAIYDDDGITDAGAFYIIHLNATGSVKSYTKISNLSFPNSNPLNNNSARSLTMIPDLDGNGTNEIITGAYRYNSDKGAVFTIFLDSNENVINYNLINYSDIPTIVSSSRFGSSVCSYGDYNQDGYFEIVVGAYKEASNTGSVFIVSLYSPLSTTISQSNIQCYGDSTGQAIASASGTSPPFTYLWSNGSTNDTISNLVAGAYSVTITNSLNATATNTVNIIQPTALVIIASNDTNICLGNSATISAAASGGTGSATLYWNNGLGNSNSHIITPNSTTTYSVYSTDANSCSSDTLDILIEVNQLPGVSFSGPTLSQCLNDNTISLIGVPSGGVFIGPGVSGNNFEPSIAGLGIHQIIYQYTDTNGCYGADSNYTLINDFPDVYAGRDTIIPCGSQGALIGETAEALHTYVWSPYAGLNNPFTSTPIANPWVNTVFIVKKTSLTTNCYNYDTVVVNLPSGLPLVEITGDTSICQGDSIHLMAIGANTYQWNNVSSGSTFNDIITTQQYISVIGTDVNNCIGKDSVFVQLIALPTPYLGADTSIFGQNSLVLNPGNYINYQWNTGAITPTITVIANALSLGNYNYAVEVEDQNGCKGNDTIVISITIGIEDNNIDKANIKLYPNPSSGVVNIEWGKDMTVNEIDIIDYQGKLIKSLKIIEGQKKSKIQLDNFPNGVYLIHLIAKDFIETVKVVKE